MKVYDVGSGSNRMTYTGFLARIDPPLFLGIKVWEKPVIELFSDPSIRTGHPATDASLRIGVGFFGPRTAAFFSPYDPSGLAVLEAMARQAYGLRVYDSYVVRSAEGLVLEPARAAAMLDSACELAVALARRREIFPDSPGELAQRAEWQRFADAAGFTFDPRRMTLTSTRPGPALKVALESEESRVCTSVSVRFPQQVGVAFTARRRAASSIFLGLLNRFIEIGDPVFDDMFKVTGRPEGMVRQVLSRPRLIAVMKQLGSMSKEMRLDHAQLFFRIDGPCTSSAELARLDEMARLVCAELLGDVASLGPYR